MCGPADSALRYLSDSQLLAGSLGQQSDSGYLLALLGFEILLKATYLIHIGPPTRNHSYSQLFEALPSEVRDRVLAAAADRMSTSANYERPAELLTAFSRNFVLLRYPYEEYELLSDETYTELGESWIEKGAPTGEATFVYYPEELHGLIEALESEINRWLA